METGDERGREKREWRTTSYRELDVIAVPEDVPETGIKAGDQGTVIVIFGTGGTLLVDVADEDGRTLDMLFMEPGPPLKIVERWRVNDK